MNSNKQRITRYDCLGADVSWTQKNLLWNSFQICFFVEIWFDRTVGRHHRWMLCGKVHGNKGRTLFSVDVLPSKNKLDHLRNKKHICLHVLTVFILTQPPDKQTICFDFEKQNSSLPYNIYVPWIVGARKTYALARARIVHTAQVDTGWTPLFGRFYFVWLWKWKKKWKNASSVVNGLRDRFNVKTRVRCG